jgi:hypothetical protein
MLNTPVQSVQIKTSRGHCELQPWSGEVGWRAVPKAPIVALEHESFCVLEAYIFRQRSS